MNVWGSADLYQGRRLHLLTMGCLWTVFGCQILNSWENVTCWPLSNIADLRLYFSIPHNFLQECTYSAGFQQILTQGPVQVPVNTICVLEDPDIDPEGSASLCIHYIHQLNFYKLSLFRNTSISFFAYVPLTWQQLFKNVQRPLEQYSNIVINTICILFFCFYGYIFTNYLI